MVIKSLIVISFVVRLTRVEKPQIQACSPIGDHYYPADTRSVENHSRPTSLHRFVAINDDKDKFCQLA